MTRPSDEGRCDICGEPLPENESMFRMHGYSGPCPKPPLPQPKADTVESLRAERDALAALLREAHTQLYSTSTSTKYSLGLLNRIDAALKDKP